MNKIRQKHHNSLNLLERVMLYIYKNTATAYFFLFCCLLLVVGLFAPQIQTQVFFISSGVIQLLMLPIINFGQDYQSRFDDLRAEHDLDIDAYNQKELEEMKVMIKAILNKLEDGKKN